MNRYHKKVGFPEADKEKLKALNTYLNGQKWSFSEHCLENVEYRAIDLENLLKYISGLTLASADIFEYYSLDGEFVKICYRVKYEIYDFILVLTPFKKIVTIYINEKDDNHITLDKTIYTKVG